MSEDRAMKSERMNSLCRWVRTVALLVSGALLAWGTAGAGATLDVDLEIRTRAESGGEKVRSRKDTMIFVLDRSGSMTNPATEVGRPSEMRDDVLKEMLRNRLDMLAETQPDAEVWVITFASAISAPQGPYSPKKDANRILKQLAEPDGQTLLYDAMARAVEFGEELMQNNPDVRVYLYFYSDGANYFPHNYWKNPNLPWWSNQEPVRYHGDDAVDRFANDFKGRIQAYADAGKMSLETGCWLGPGEPPVMIENKRKDEYKLELAADGTSLKNPAAVPSQGLKARLLVPLPERYAKDLDRLEGALVFEAGKQRSVARFSLAPGKQKVRLDLPDGLPSSAFKGQMRVSALPDAWKSVALAEPEPVELSFAEPGTLSLSGMTPRGESWVATGTPVEFSATASEGAEVTWSIDGKEVGKGTIQKAFGRAGTYRAVATAQKAGFRPATAECTVHAVDTAVAVEASAGACVGVPMAFEAKSAGGEDVSWWVDGQPAEGKGMRLEEWIFDESGHHTAKARVYFGHGLSGEGEAHFEVSVAPRVVIAAPLSGEAFGFGEKFQAMAKVEGNFDRVVWTLRGPEEATIEAEVDREERRSMPASFAPGKGGDYELTAVAEGAAGRLESQPVRFTVAREDAWVRIDEPASGARVSTGADMVLKASARGEEAREIRWTVKDAGGATVFSATRPTEGGVSQCAFHPPETLGNGTMLFVTAEAVGDPALRAEIDIETRCSNCAAMGATLSLAHAGEEGRTFGRGEKIVAELKNLRGEVRDIEWTFGKTDHAKGRVVEWGGWDDYGVYGVKASGRCAKCGAAHEFGQESVIVERHPVTAAFEIKERGSYYTAGGKLHLSSTSTGDITDYIWTVDGEELAEAHGKPTAEVDLPFNACDLNLRLVVRGAESGEEVSCERGVRVRFGWVAALLFLLAALLVLWPLWMLLTGNGPSGWGIKAWVAPEPALDAEGKEAEKAFAKQRTKGRLPAIRKYWHMGLKRERKLGLVPLSALVSRQMSSLLGVKDPSKEFVHVKPRAPLSGKVQGLPSLKRDTNSFPPEKTLDTDSKLYYLFYPSQKVQKEAKAKGEEVYCLRVVLDRSREALRHAVLLFLLAALLLGGVAWACLNFAI